MASDDINQLIPLRRGSAGASAHSPSLRRFTVALRGPTRSMLCCAKLYFLPYAAPNSSAGTAPGAGVVIPAIAPRGQVIQVWEFRVCGVVLYTLAMHSIQPGLLQNLVQTPTLALPTPHRCLYRRRAKRALDRAAANGGRRGPPLLKSW